MKNNSFFRIFLTSVSANYSNELNALMEEYKIQIKSEISKEIDDQIEKVRNINDGEILTLDNKTITMCVGALAMVRRKIESL